MTDKQEASTKIRIGWLLIIAWVVFSSLPYVMPTAAKAGFLGAFIALVTFAFVHGSGRYGWRAMALFFVAIFLVCNVMEALSITTGFPFGFFEHQPAMGPRIFVVPLVIGPSYFMLGYLAWTVANRLLGEPDNDRHFGSLVALALASALIVSGIDATVDPLGATIAKNWIYREGGGYFGVPLSNYGGWILTTFIGFLAAAWLMRRYGGSVGTGQPLAWWSQPAILLMCQALPNILGLLFVPDRAVFDAGGRLWNTAWIFEGTTIVGLFTCVSFGLIALLAAWRASSQNQPR